MRTTLALTFVLCGSIRAQEQAPDPEKVRNLIGKLNSDDSSERESASRSLLELGDPVRPLLENAQRGATAEVSARISKILELLDFGLLASRAPWDFEIFKKEIGDAFALKGVAKRKTLRRLGILLSDEEFAAAEKIIKPVHQKTAIIEHWVALRPKQAARWGFALTRYVPTKKDDFRGLTGQIVIQWALKDPDAARAWVRELPEGELRKGVMDELDKKQ